MKKILFIINSLNKGGAERVVSLLSNQMAAEGNDVHIICVERGCAFYIDNRVKIHYLGRNKKGLINIIKIKLELEKKVKALERDCQFDLITTHLFYAHFVTCISLLKNRAVYVMHSIYSQKFQRNMFYGKLISFMYKNRKLIVVSKGLEKELEEYWRLGNRTKITVINNPIDIDYIKKLSEQELKFKDKFIISIGRLSEEKRFDLLIKAFWKSSLKDSYKLIILGEGEQQERLESLIKYLEAEDRIFLKGWSNNPFNWIKNASLYVCTSMYECFPVSLLESLCCGTPIVSFNCCYGPSEILTGELSDFLVENSNVDKLIAVMEKAVEKYPVIDKSCYSSFSVQRISNLYLNIK